MNPRLATLTAALDIATREGYSAMTRDGVAKQAGVAAGMVNHVWGSMDALRDAVMHAAVRRRVLPIIAHGLVTKHPAMDAADEMLKREALDSILQG